MHLYALASLMCGREGKGQNLSRLVLEMLAGWTSVLAGEGGMNMSVHLYQMLVNVFL